MYYAGVYINGTRSFDQHRPHFAHLFLPILTLQGAHSPIINLLRHPSFLPLLLKMNHYINVSWALDFHVFCWCLLQKRKNYFGREKIRWRCKSCKFSQQGTNEKTWFLCSQKCGKQKARDANKECQSSRCEMREWCFCVYARMCYRKTTGTQLSSV